ncbi:uncharacterized protein TM35_000401410, partial [Trypanosoma theileri]
MTGGVHVRAAAAVRTAVLWVSLCMLLQHLGHHPQFTAEAQGLVQVKILRYLTLPNSVFSLLPGQTVNYGNSLTLCNMNGAFLASGQSTAAQNTITDQMKAGMPTGDTLSTTYMGGDAMYTVNVVPNPELRCTPGIEGASANCVYRWNMGLFKSGVFDQGVPFYRGSL